MASAAESDRSDRSTGDTVLLVDGHSLAFRAFYGYPVASFSTSTGQYTNAVFGFITLLTAVVKAEQPSHVGVAFDHSKVTFRTNQYPQYKATRSAAPAEFAGQVDLIKDVLTALNISQVEVDGYEGDDIIATWTRQATQRDWTVLIQTGDRDSYQLVDDQVTVLYPSKDGVVRMTPAAIEAKYDVRPRRYPELAALTGETSDNLPGVPGVGPKTAAKWLNQYDGLENLLRRAGQVPGKAGESLRAHLGDVERNRRLNALVTDLALPLDVADLDRRAPDAAALEVLFDTLQFRGLRERVRQVFAGPTFAGSSSAGSSSAGPSSTGPSSTGPATPDHAASPAAADVTRLAPGAVADWLDRHGRGRVGLSFLAESSRGAWDVLALAIASGDGATGWVDLADVTAGDDQALGAWLADPTVDKVVHDAKGPLMGLWQRGWDLNGVGCDTQLAAYLANPDRRVFDLASLSERYLGRTWEGLAKTAGPQPAFDFDQSSSPRDDGQRARTILDLGPVIDRELADRGADQLLTQIELPLQRVLARMETNGVGVDGDFLDHLRHQFDGAVRQAEQSAFAAIGHDTNLSSPKQLQGVLFDELGMPKTRKTKSGYTTDAEALDWLYSVTGHPFLEYLLAHRDAIRLRQTVEGLIKTIGDDGRIHTTYLQTVAATGRLSSQDPNLQNIPTRTPAGNQIRQGFVPGPGYEALMSVDYSQIEMRIMADVSGDAGLIEAFRSGQDFHTVMAARVFGVAPSAVTAAERSRVKAVNYGLAYGLSAFGLSQQLKIPVGEAQLLMDGYFEQFGGVRRYLNSLVAEARQVGYTQTLLGRRRYLPDLNSPNRTRRDMAERMALNAPIQGTAADIVKLAMLRVAQQLADGFGSRMLLQVHDELVFEVAPGETERLEAMVRQQMSTALDLRVPLTVAVGVGDNWAAAAH